MEEYVVIFRSITPAQQAMRVLEHAGIQGVLMRTPKRAGRGSCSYCIRLPRRQAELAAQCLREGEIAYAEICRWPDFTRGEMP